MLFDHTPSLREFPVEVVAKSVALYEERYQLKLRKMKELTRKWVKTFEMSAMVGISPISLTRRAKKNDGYLIRGTHYNQLGDNNSPFYWNVEKTIEAFKNWGAPVKGGAE